MDFSAGDRGGQTDKATHCKVLQDQILPVGAAEAPTPEAAHVPSQAQKSM